MAKSKEVAIKEEQGQIEPDAQIQVVRSADTLDALDRGEVDIQIATAKRYPRSIAKFKEELLEAVRENRDVAASCYYTLSRAGKRIEGPSIRLAELAASAWRNCRVTSGVVAETDSHIVAQGGAFDLERNVAFQTEIRKRITDSKGRRYNDDLITITANAAAAIALRNAILKMIPRVYLNDAYKKARAVAAGEAKDLESGRKKALAEFKKLGVEPEQVYRYLGIRGEAEMTTEDLADLWGLKTAIEDGDAKVEDIFGTAKRGGEEGRHKFGFAKAQANAADEKKVEDIFGTAKRGGEEGRHKFGFAKAQANAADEKAEGKKEGEGDQHLGFGEVENLNGKEEVK